jgi:hypothetical protein
MRPQLALLLSALALAACAEGQPVVPTVDRGPAREALSFRDAGIDGYVWPDLGQPPDAFIWPDLCDAGDGPLDGPSDQRAPDLTLSPDSQVVCNDVFEPNETCVAARALGSILEGSGWKSSSATANPATDVDWYSAEGLEDSHTCFPLTSQCYYFKVQLIVPAGRELKVCVLSDSCTGSMTCANNQGSPGPKTLTVQFKVSGTCGFDDDTSARILVTPLDTGGCATYSVGFRYDEC